MAKIVLASGSPRRRELLERIGIRDFDIRVPETEEICPEGLSPQETVSYISREKAEAAAALRGESGLSAVEVAALCRKWSDQARHNYL